MVLFGGHGFIRGRGVMCVVLLGGMRGFIQRGGGGACVILFGGACVVLFRGHAWFYSGGHAWFYLGAYVVLFGGPAWSYLGGMHGFIQGCAWFYSGGVHGFIWGACMVLFGWACMVLFRGGMCGFFSFFGYNEIRSMSGRYASYWNAFLFGQETRSVT